MGKKVKKDESPQKKASNLLERSETKRIGRNLVRPHTDQDWEDLDNLLKLGATLEDIYKFFGCSERTIENRVNQVKGMRFCDYASQKREDGKLRVRKLQMDCAEAGNHTMLIWLGKNLLGQKDTVDFNHKIYKPCIIEGSDGKELMRLGRKEEINEEIIDIKETEEDD